MSEIDNNSTNRDFILRGLAEQADFSEIEFEGHDWSSITTQYDETQNDLIKDILKQALIDKGIDEESISDEFLDLIIEEAVENATANNDGKTPTLGQVADEIEKVIERYDSPDDIDAGDVENDDSNSKGLDSIYEGFGTNAGGYANYEEVKTFFSDIAEELSIEGDLLAEFYGRIEDDATIDSDSFKALVEEFYDFIESNSAGDSEGNVAVDEAPGNAEDDDPEMDDKPTFKATSFADISDENKTHSGILEQIKDDIFIASGEIDSDPAGRQHQALINNILAQLGDGYGDPTEAEYTAALHFAEKIIGEDLFSNVNSDAVEYDAETGEYSVIIGGEEHKYTPPSGLQNKYQLTAQATFNGFESYDEDATPPAVSRDDVEAYITGKLEKAGLDADDYDISSIISGTAGGNEDLSLKDFNAVLAFVELQANATGDNDNIFDFVTLSSTNTVEAGGDGTFDTYNLELPDGSILELNVNDKGQYAVDYGTETQSTVSEEQQSQFSQEVLNETADAYFENILGEDREGAVLERNPVSYNEPLVSELGLNSPEIIDLKSDLKALLGSDYDEDSIDIVVQAAISNLQDNPEATLDDLYDEVNKLIQGKSEYTPDDTDDTDDSYNITNDFGTGDDLFNALLNKNLDSVNDSGTFDSSTISYNTTINNTLEPNAVRSFLDGYFDPPLPAEYINLLLDAADSDKSDNISKDEFKSILKKINADILVEGQNATDDNPLGLPLDIQTATDLTVDEALLSASLGDHWTVNPFTPSATTFTTPQNLGSETRIEYDRSFSDDVLADTTEAFFDTITNRSTQTFAPDPNNTAVDETKKISEQPDDAYLAQIRADLGKQFGASPEIADLIIQQAINGFDDPSNATVSDLYAGIEALIQTDIPTDTSIAEPNILEDFGSVPDLFNILNNDTKETLPDGSTLITADDTLAQDTIMAFLQGYIDPAVLEDKGITPEALKELIDDKGNGGSLNAVQFEQLLYELNDTLNGDDTEANYLGLPPPTLVAF